MARILIVDDQDNARGMLSEMLRAEDYDVDQAPSGESACAMVAEKSYDLVITDSENGRRRRPRSAATHQRGLAARPR